MSKNELCYGCAQRHECKSIYQTLGNAKGPSMVWKVVFVFLVPIAVFIMSIAGFGLLLKERIASESARTAVTFILAFLMGIASAGLVRWLAPAWSKESDTEPDGKTKNGNTREKDI